MPDMVDGFMNELDYQKKVSPNATSTAALQWAHDEIAQLRAALAKIENLKKTTPHGLIISAAEQIARAALTPDKQRDEIGYVPKDDPRLNTIIGPPRLPDKQRNEP
jgi:hypothetical protein